VALAAFAGNFIFLSSLTMSCYRYPADFLGPLLLVTGIGICTAPLASPISRAIFRFGAWVLTIFGLAASLAVAASIAQITELFDTRRPDAFTAMARPANIIGYEIERLTGAGPKCLVLDLIFPPNKFGSSEPALVVGENGSQDFVYFYYAGPGQLKVGFESMGLGGTVSKPVSIDYGKPHNIVVSLGSFLPPEGYPSIAVIPKAELELERRTIAVSIDGSTVLLTTVHLHRPEAQIFVGSSPFDSAFGQRFTGKIIHERWIPLSNQLQKIPPAD
jgi:hypothetical protein